MKYAYLAGRSASGASRDAGPLVHALPGEWPDYDTCDFGKAVCGAQPGTRSAGWERAKWAEAPTCPKCLKKLARMQGAWR